MKDLRIALAAIHGDRGWWHKVGLGGLLMLTLLGYPWADGFLMQSVENSKRGYPTPLPPWGDWGVRYVIGLLGTLIDLTFFVVPLLLAGLLLFCGGAVALIAVESTPLLGWLLGAGGAVVGLYLLVVFVLGLSPVARLVFAEEGAVEDALGSLPLREATAPAARRDYVRARLFSLPLYLPALILGGLTWLAAGAVGDWAALLTLVLLWLTLCAIFYARLVALQLYVNAERGLRRKGVMRVQPKRREEPGLRGR